MTAETKVKDQRTTHNKAQDISRATTDRSSAEVDEQRAAATAAASTTLKKE